MSDELMDIEGLLSRTMDDEEIAAEILDCYMEDTPDCLKKLVESAESGDLNECKERSHEIKGSSASVGAVKASEIASSIQKEAEAGNIDNVKQLTGKLATAYDETLIVIKNLDLMK